METGWDCDPWDAASIGDCLQLPLELAILQPHRCEICYRNFKTADALTRHLESAVHDAKKIKCPNCSRAFKSASACTMHIESRACVDITLDQIVTGVRNWEMKSGNINLLTVPRLDCPQISDRPETSTKITYFATEASFDGFGFRCCVCDAVFLSLTALNQHLNSPAHHSQEFRCKKCGLTCIMLSSLIQHVESRVCGAFSPEDGAASANPLLYIQESSSSGD